MRLTKYTAQEEDVTGHVLTNHVSWMTKFKLDMEK